MPEVSIENAPANSDIMEDDIRVNMPLILEILLTDRTKTTLHTTQNIIWANDNYREYGDTSYAATSQIAPELITGEKGNLIMPRALKTAILQKERTKTKAEVFTPAWIVKKQNDIVDIEYKLDDLETYTRRKWLEITCGEAPYMATRYDMATGELIPLTERVGFIDRKLSRINEKITDKAEWQRLVELAYKSSYGFEWNGDSLLLARENLLYTYRDYYFKKWSEPPIYGLFEAIANIISYNVFQMDGLTYTIPLSETREQVQSHQLSLFTFDKSEKVERHIVPGKRAKVMNWETNRMEYFDQEIKNGGKQGVRGRIGDSELQCGDLTETAKNGGSLEMKFDVVVGNPPYQERGEARDEPIYHYFYDLAEQTAQRYCLISPARFLFNAGQTPKTWNAKMLNDKHLKVLLYEQNSATVFANTDIKGGVTIVYRDDKQIYGSIGVFTHYDELSSVVNKTTKINGVDFSTIVQPQGIYRFSELFFADFPQAEDMQGKGTKNKIVSKSFSQMDFAFHKEKTESDDINMLGLVGGKREYRWISAKYLVLPESFAKWRVIIAETNNTGILGETLSNPLIGNPNIAHTDTFLTVGTFDTEAEANAVLKFIKTKFTRLLLGVLKITQHNSRTTWAKVPLQDFTPQSDIDWSQSIPDVDRQLYAKYGLDDKEVAFIEEKVKAMG